MQLAPSPLGAKKEFSGSGRYPNPNPNPNPNSNPNSTVPEPTPKQARDATVGIDSALLESLEAEGRARGLDAATLLDMVLRESLGIDED